MGKACSNAAERVLASFGVATATTKFDEQTDLSCAGVLLSLPALLSNGLLNHSKDFKLENVYYTEEMIFVCLAFLSLLRVQNINQAGTIPCGELGRVMGLDRIPEVKTLRRRIARFSAKGNVQEWSRKLSESWMAANTGLAGVLYIDGHVNLYYGHATTMPKRFVSRLRLCMSGSTDYWVNDKTGQPFFVVNEVINSGMIEQIKTSILPRLEKDVPNQPSEKQPLQNSKLNKFMIVCDRECYSAEFFDYLWQKRVAICTYNKNVKDKWPEEDFTLYETTLEDGTAEKLKLAEKEITLTFGHEKDPKEIKCREVRKLSKSGHQTSIITTNRILDILAIGLYMFARWCQENFFKYMMDNFDIDGLVSYSMEKISETKMLVNPAYKQLDSKLKSLNGKLSKQKLLFANTTLKIENEKGKRLTKAIAKKAEIYQEIEVLESKITEIKNKKKKVDRKITFASLPPEEKFSNVINVRKQFMDNIKMIAYRAETAMYNLIKSQLGQHHQDEGRKLLQQVYSSDADIIPDYSNKTLTVKLHNFNNKKEDRVVQYLCEKLNETETEYPGTDLRIIYKLVSS
jgi:cell division septum initiation protein DivIVA